MSDEKKDSTTIPAYFVNAGTVSSSQFSVHFVAGLQVPDGSAIPNFMVTMGTEFAEELGKQILRAVEESRRARETEERPKLVAEV